MAMYVYSTDGEPIGFLFETSIYDLGGTPLGRIIGSRVHRFDGSYVGEWHKETVVERPAAGQPRALPPIAVPPRRPPEPVSWRRRAVVYYGVPDVFHRLYHADAAGETGGGLVQAAE
jgi:hypothetical protein